MVNIISEYKLDYLGNNPALRDGEDYDFRVFADRIGLGDDGPLYLLEGKTMTAIPPAEENSDYTAFTYTNINCDSDAVGDRVSTRKSDAVGGSAPVLKFTAANPARGESTLKGNQEKISISYGTVNKNLRDEEGNLTGKSIQWTSEWNFDANQDNQADATEVYYTPYTVAAPVPFPTPVQDTPVQVITYKIAPIPKPADRV